MGMEKIPTQEVAPSPEEAIEHKRNPHEIIAETELAEGYERQTRMLNKDGLELHAFHAAVSR
jgi:hypothetical protein